MLKPEHSEDVFSAMDIANRAFASDKTLTVPDLEWACVTLAEELRRIDALFELRLEDPDFWL